MPAWVHLRGVKPFVWPSLLLIAALALAIMSSLARRNGQYYAGAFLAVVALVFAFIVCVTLVPRLLARIQLDFLNSLRFFRFTQRGLFFTLIVFIISFATFNTGNNLLILILAFLLASMIVSGVVANLVLYGLKIRLTVPPRIHVGQKAIFLLTLQNMKKLFPSFALQLKGEGRVGGQTENDGFLMPDRRFPYLRARESLKLRLPCSFGQRGIYSVDGFEIKTTFPFGFFWRGRELDAKGQIIVYPELLELGGLFRRYPRSHGVHPQNQRGTGSELHNIRHYQEGDTARFVHWKSTAKMGSLMVKELAREEELPLSFLFSTYLPDPSAANLQKFEKAVSYLASLGHYYHQKGHQFCFSSGEFEVTVNGKANSYDELMEYLSQVRPGPRLPLVPPDPKAPCLLFAAGDSVDAVEGTSCVDYLSL